MVRPCVRAPVRPCARASVRPRVRASVRSCVRAFVRSCVIHSLWPAFTRTVYTKALYNENVQRQEQQYDYVKKISS